MLQLIQFSRIRSGFPPGTLIGGIPVGGLNQQQAADRVVQAYNTPIELIYKDQHIHVKPSPRANAMPILINSNEAVLRVDVGPAGLKLRVTVKRDKTAKTLDKVVEAFDIPPRAK